jgi:glycosyltransferase involved in cell wall biosynthesis
LEIVVVDNESSDDSRAVAQQHDAKLREISRRDFTYGRALNMGIRDACGEFVCILSAHSLPIGPDFLRKAIAPFGDCKVAAVRCLSVTNRNELENWMEPKVLEWPVEIETVISSAPANCASMIRRSVWEQIPYDETLASVEDKFWAFQVLKSGYRICNSTAVYLYLRDFGLGDKVRTLHRDRIEFFRKTGRQWQEPPVSMLRLLSNAFYNIPRRAFRAAVYEAAIYVCLKTIPYQVRRKQKAS